MPFDSLALKVTDKKGASKYFGNQYVDTSCLYASLTVSGAGKDAECQSKTNMMKLQL